MPEDEKQAPADEKQALAERKQVLDALSDAIKKRGYLLWGAAVILLLIVGLVLAVGTYVIITTSDPTDSSLAIAIIARRVSILVLVLFVAQICVSAFRYTIRLAAFYYARYDAIAAWKAGGTEDLAKLVNAFSPDHIEIAETPAPIEQLVRLVEKLRA